MQKNVTTHAPGETQQLAASIAERLGTLKLERAAVVTLRGDLGAGKTTFTQGLLKELGVEDHVTSPTFVLVQRYPLDNGKFKNAYHVDAYRLVSAADLDSLELTGPLANPENVFIVEWPEVGGDLFTPNVDVMFAHGLTPEVRHITVTWNA